MIPLNKSLYSPITKRINERIFKMKVTDVILIPAQISGAENGSGILLNVQYLYAYKDNQKTDTIIGYAADVVFPNMQYTKCKIKVFDTASMHLLQEQLKAAKGNGINCQCHNLRGKFYFSSADNNYKLSAQADRIDLLNP